MENIQRAALPLAALFCATVAYAAPPRAASQADQEIMVSAPARNIALADWSKRVERDLEAKMRSSSRINETFAEGMVTVGFTCSGSGRADGITLIRSSGSPALDRQAMRAVRGLGSLHPMVTGMRSQQKIAAQMLYMNNYSTNRAAARRVQELEAAAQARNAWFTREQVASGEVLLLGAAL